jgi:restriction system protein
MRRAKHAEPVAAAQATPEQQVRNWNDNNSKMHAAHVTAVAAQEKGEADRLLKFAEADTVYKVECVQRETDAAARNED